MHSDLACSDYLTVNTDTKKKKHKQKNETKGWRDDGGSHYISVTLLKKDNQIMPTLCCNKLNGRKCVDDLIYFQKEKKGRGREVQ